MENLRSIYITTFLFCSLLTYSCKKESADSTVKLDHVMQIPEGFPSIIFPEGNEYTPERWALGKQLFYDPILSKNNTLSCGSCHKAELAFSDNVAFSIGDQNEAGSSNAPTLTNIAYHPYYTRSGGVPTLEMQILVPIQEHNEFNTNILDIAERLKKIPAIVEQSMKAYGREPDAYVITRSIANFERSIVSGNSLYDQFQFQGKANALNATEKKGKDLFYSTRTNCSQCHSGFNFTNYSFENNGLYVNYKDSGRMRLTHLESDRARFKVPTLRNISLTAPYMHDGSIKTLEEVVNHYNNGGQPALQISSLVHPLGLSEDEKKQLVAFLQSLSDPNFINNKQLKNEP